MEEPQPIHCLVCSAECTAPARRVSELQVRVASRLRTELAGQPAPQQQEALCTACVHLLGDLDELLMQVDRLRRQLRRRRAAGRRAPRRAVKVKPEKETDGDADVAGPVSVAVCNAELSESPAGAPQSPTAPPDGDTAAVDSGTAGPASSRSFEEQPDEARTDSESSSADEEDSEEDKQEDEEEEETFVRPAPIPDDRALLGLPSSLHPNDTDPDDPLGSEANDPGDSVDIVGPDLPPGTKVMGTQVTPKTSRRRRPAAKRAAPPASPPEDPWERVDGPSPFQCTVCGRQFQYLNSIKIHARTHTGERPHECDICGRKFAIQTTLKNHRRLHTGDKPYKCEDCGRTFAQHSYLIVHRKTHSNDKPFCCEVCGKTFKQAYYLNIHKRIHSGEKPYTCDYCGKGFATVSNMYKHRRGHGNEKRYCCEQCGKTFRDSCHLTDHRRSHTGERPFVCEVCGMTFAIAKILARHARMHTGEKPYVCIECGKAFSRKETLRDHAKVHEIIPVTEEVGEVAAAAAALGDGTIPSPELPPPAPVPPPPPPPSLPPPSMATDDRGYYMVDVMPVSDVEDALSWPLEVYRTETGVTVYKTLGEDGSALYQTETGEVFREMSGDAETVPPPGVGDVTQDRLFEDAAAALPAYDRLGI